MWLSLYSELPVAKTTNGRALLIGALTKLLDLHYFDMFPLQGVPHVTCATAAICYTTLCFYMTRGDPKGESNESDCSGLTITT